MERQIIKVFVSYSWTSVSHKEWVKKFVADLEQNSIEVAIDFNSLHVGQDKYFYMEKMVTSAEIAKVILLIDKQYCDKANNRNGGVGVETQIISAEVYEKADQVKFLPIVLQKDYKNEPYLPTYLRNRIYFDFSDPVKYDERLSSLVQNIRTCEGFSHENFKSENSESFEKKALNLNPVEKSSLYQIVSQKKSSIITIFKWILGIAGAVLFFPAFIEGKGNVNFQAMSTTEFGITIIGLTLIILALTIGQNE